jgi:outer membrane lipoprotein-sorting protein
MSRSMMRRSMLTAALIAPAVIFAQKPTAQSVFDKHAAAVGGVAAFRAVTARTESGTAEITWVGMTAGYERKVSGGKLLMTIDVAGFGQVLQGYDGAVAWSMNPQSGAQKLDASTSADAASSTSATAGLWEAGSYTSAEVLDAATWEGVSVWPVKIVGSSGRTRTVYYDQATGLKIGEVLQQDGATQKILYADYKPFGALKVPTKVTQGTPNGDIVLNITSVKFDPIEASVFALPDAVKALP